VRKRGQRLWRGGSPSDSDGPRVTPSCRV